MNSQIKEIKSKIVEILKKHGVVRAGIFGSYAKGENKKGSDIDILVKTSKPLGFEFIGIKLELEDKLGKKVDLLTYKAIHPLLKKRILKEEIRII
ncbi:MAG: nucleotidyltransferase family protein [Nanoarchaeota archaeon]|nr:nucleotidyltransferase family protein [Nanoarchaeota archaeon]